MLERNAVTATSLDGVDAAVVETDGVTIAGFGPSDYRPYSAEEQAVLRAGLGRWPGEPGVDAAAALVQEAHAQVLERFQDVDLVGFHGQTLAHDPAGRGTHQAGSGAWLADRLGLPVVWDFRSSDVRLGGQGAPLAPFFHFACARWIGADAPLAFLNLGGVGNLTWIDPAAPAPEAPEAPAETADAPVGRLARTRNVLASALADLVGAGLDDAAWERLEEGLIAADVGVQATTGLVAEVRRGARERGVRDVAGVRALLHDALVGELSSGARALARRDGDGPTVWLVTGVNGAGKTTTIGKLAAREAAAGRSVGRRARTPHPSPTRAPRRPSPRARTC